MTEDRFEDMLGELASDYNKPPAVPREEMWARIQAARAGSAPDAPAAPVGVEQSDVLPFRRRAVPAWAGWGLGLAAMLLIGIAIGRLTRVEQAGRGAVAVGTPSQATTQPQDTAAGQAGVAVPDTGAGAVAPGTVAGVTPDTQGGAVVERRMPGSDVSPRMAAASSPERGSQSQGAGFNGTRATGNATMDLPYRLAAVQHLTRAEALLTSYEAEAKAGRRDEQMQAWSKDLLSTTRLLLDSPAGRDPKLRPLLEDLELVLAQIRQATAGRTQERDMVVQSMEARGVLPRLRTAIPAGS